MDLAILGRLAPAVIVAVTVAAVARTVPSAAAKASPGRGEIGRGLRWAVDEVLWVLVVGVVVGRVTWLVLEGPVAWRSAFSTVFLLRSGVETWVGIGAVVVLLLRRARRPGQAAIVTVGATAGLAGLATWQALCGVEGVCAGRPASWGVTLPGYLGPVIPAGYIEAGVAAALAAVAWRWRDRPAVAAGSVALYALARGLLAFWRAPLTSLPTRDQILSLVVAAVLAALAWRWRSLRAATEEVTA